MGSAVDDLLGLLELDQPEPLRFESRPVDTSHQNLYGGQAVAQALMAAGRSVDPTRMVHSMHAYFVRRGKAAEPVTFEVEAIRDSQTFNTRRVVAHQAGRELLSLEASFHRPETGHDLVEAMPEVLAPDDMVPTDDWLLSVELPNQDVSIPHFVDAVEFRQDPQSLGGPGRDWPRGLREPSRDMWIRARDLLPDDPLVHACVLAYASDKPMLGTTVLSPPLGGDARGHMVSSIDHSMWFHRPFRIDEWLLTRQESTITGSGRVFATAEMRRPDGALAVHVTQEGLLRRLG